MIDEKFYPQLKNALGMQILWFIAEQISKVSEISQVRFEIWIQWRSVLVQSLYIVSALIYRFVRRSSRQHKAQSCPPDIGIDQEMAGLYVVSSHDDILYKVIVR